MEIDFTGREVAMDPESADVLKETCPRCNGKGTRVRFGLDGTQQVELCSACYGKGQVYTNIDQTIARLADQAIMRLLRKSDD